MKDVSFRLISFLLLLTFSFHQISFSFPTSLTPVYELNSQAAFEQYLTTEHNKDASGVSEHDRRTSEIRSQIESVYSALQIYFGLTSGSLNPTYLALLKILKSDPAFQLKELNQAELDKIKQRLLALTTEDIHFGQSAVSSMNEFLSRRIPYQMMPSILTLTVLALFSDILTGVISSEFSGNLQFSAYTLKALMESFAVKTIGLKLTWPDLVKIVQAGYSVIANIEDRHFLVVTAISCQSSAVSSCSAESCQLTTEGCTVTFLENGYTRTKSAAEFNSKWFGVVLVDQAVKTDSRLTIYDSQILKTADLLKVKGAGWFKRLFRKIKQFFQKVAQAVVKVLQKVQAALQKFFATGFGKVVSFMFGGPLIMAALNVAINTAHYLSQGDFKGLMKYWGSMALQLAIMAAVAIVAPYILGPVMGFLGSGLQWLGASVLRFGLAHLGQGILGAIVRSAGSSLIHFGASLVGSGAGSFLQGFKSGGFSSIQDSLKTGFSNSLNRLNPLGNIGIGSSVDGINLSGNLFKTFLGGAQQSAKSSFLNNGFFKLLGKVGEAISFQWLQNKIDKKIESSKMNSFLKSILHTLTSIGTQALSAGVMALASAALPGIGAALGGVGKFLGQGLKAAGSFLANGIKSIGSAIGNGFQALGRGISSTFSGVKSFFSNLNTKIFGVKTPPVNAAGLEIKKGSASFFDSFGAGRFSLGEKFAYASNDGVPTTLFQDGKSNPFGLEKLSYDNIFRADTDGGSFSYLKYDPISEVFSEKNIGNLNVDDLLKSPEERLFQDARVQRALAHAIRKSTSNPKSVHEEGGFILQDLKGRIQIKNIRSGSQDELRFPAHLDGRIGNRDIIGSFHTHPNFGIDPKTGDTWNPKPSDPDIQNMQNFPTAFGPIHYVVAYKDKIYALDNQGNITEVGNTDDLFK